HPPGGRPRLGGGADRGPGRAPHRLFRQAGRPAGPRGTLRPDPIRLAAGCLSAAGRGAAGRHRPDHDRRRNGDRPAGPAGRGVMDQAPGPQTEFSLIQLLPNMLTIVAVCAGLTAIRFGMQGDYMPAVLLIIGAGILDGIDGRIARLLGSSSKMGAELDSLADFLNFGVAPPLILYFWALKDIRSLGWICVLVFAVCCVIRLARFNVSSKSEEAHRDSAYFEGIPSPAGALLVMLPMYLSFAFADRPVLPQIVICLHMILV